MQDGVDILTQNIIHHPAKVFEPERFANSPPETEASEIGHQRVVGVSAGYNGFSLRIQLQQTSESVKAAAIAEPVPADHLKPLFFGDPGPTRLASG